MNSHNAIRCKLFADVSSDTTDSHYQDLPNLLKRFDRWKIPYTWKDAPHTILNSHVE